MPMIYRHVVPNAYNWTPGNGQLVYSPVKGVKLSHRKSINFFARWVGDVDLSAAAAYCESQSSDWVFDYNYYVSASTINAAIGAAAFCGPTTYDALPVEEFDAAVHPPQANGDNIMLDTVSIDTQSGGDVWFEWSLLYVGIAWDASRLGWFWWACPHRTCVIHLKAHLRGDPQSVWDYPNVGNIAPGMPRTAPLVFAQALNQTSVRAPQSIPYASSSADRPWLADAFRYTSLDILAAYA